MKVKFVSFFVFLSFVFSNIISAQWQTDSTNNNVYYNSGNVGIGTSVPSKKFHVVGDAWFEDNILTDSNSTNTRFGFNAGKNNLNTLGTFLGMSAGLNNSGQYATILGAFAGQNNSGNYSVFIGDYAGGDNTALRGVGIGSYALNGNSGSNSTGIGVGAGNFNQGSGLLALGLNAGRNNTGNEVVAIGVQACENNSGIANTGIGSFALKGNSGNYVVAIGRGAGQDNTLSNQFIVKHSSVSSTPLIQGNFDSGKVGIGLVSATEKLEVAGNVKANQFIGDGSQLSGITTEPVFWSGDTTSIYFSTGKVGIGTNTPQSELAVNGTITAKDVKVTTTGWSDYVFEENYNLRSLEEVESFIKENKHLPDIPSEREVVSSGVSLAEMQKKLLAKVEELTLYIIHQNKVISELKDQINSK